MADRDDVVVSDEESDPKTIQTSDQRVEERIIIATEASVVQVQPKGIENIQRPSRRKIVM